MRHNFFTSGVYCLVLAGLLASPLYAALNADQKKELKELGNEISKATSLISKKKFDDATTAIQQAEDHLAKFVKDTDLKETDPVLKPLHVQLEKAHEKLAKASGKGTVTFEKNVASIFASKCVSCHGDDPKGGLNLDSFEGLEKGGRSG